MLWKIHCFRSANKYYSSPIHPIISAHPTCMIITPFPYGAAATIVFRANIYNYRVYTEMRHMETGNQQGWRCPEKINLRSMQDCSMCATVYYKWRLICVASCGFGQEIHRHGQRLGKPRFIGGNHLYISGLSLLIETHIHTHIHIYI